MELVTRFVEAFAGILGDAGLWLLAGFAAAGLLHEFVPRRWLAAQLGRRGPVSVIKGALIGAPLPLCSCSVIPAAAALRSSGASKGAAASFAVATPEIDAPAFSLTWALLGPVMAVARVIGATATAITAGLLVDAVSKDDRPLPIASSGCGSGCGCHDAAEQSEDEPEAAEPRSLPGRIARATRYGFVDLPADLAGWLIAGLLISAAVGAFLPATLLTGEIGEGPLAIVAAMALGLVIYVCATGSTPLVAVLVAKGLGPGPALAFLLAGPATNPATMAWVLKDLGRSALAVYVASISGVAFLCGWGLQWLAAGAWTPQAEPMTEHAGGSALGGALLAALLAFAMIRGAQSRLAGFVGRKQPKSCCGHATSSAGPSVSTD